MSDTATEGQQTETKNRFAIRDMIIFPIRKIIPGDKQPIVIRANPGRGEAVIDRIIMHRSIATKLVLESIYLGDKLMVGPGGGTCEAFLAEAVPNWTPEGWVIDDSSTFLTLNVINPAQVSLTIVGSCIVRCRGKHPQ